MDADYSKSHCAVMEPWSSLGLDFEMIKKCIVAIKVGNLEALQLIFESKDLTSVQKQALLTKCFNTKDFYEGGAFMVTNAISLAEKYGHKVVLEYLLKQKKLYVTLLSEKGFLSHKKISDDTKSTTPIITSSKKFN